MTRANGCWNPACCRNHCSSSAAAYCRSRGQNGDVDVEVLRLGPGDHFGEIGVLTDKPSTATIVALTPVALYELAKADLGRIVEARPEVARELAGAMARRQGR